MPRVFGHVAFAAMVSLALMLCAFWNAQALASLLRARSAAPARLGAAEEARLAAAQRGDVRRAELSERSRTRERAGAPASVRDPAPVAIEMCRGFAATIVTESSDATWSSAVLKADHEPRGRSCRVGDSVAGWRVELIGFNARAGTPAIWLSRGRSACRLDLFAQPAPAPLSGPETRSREVSQSSSVPKEMAARVQRVSEREVRMDRSFVEWVLADPSPLMREARILPERGEGGAVGLRLVRARPDGVLGLIGLAQGDVIHSINGFDVGNPERALEAFARLRVASRLELRLERAGRELHIDYEVR